METNDKTEIGPDSVVKQGIQFFNGLMVGNKDTKVQLIKQKSRKKRYAVDLSRKRSQTDAAKADIGYLWNSQDVEFQDNVQQSRIRSKTEADQTTLPVYVWEELLRTELSFFQKIDELLAKQHDINQTLSVQQAEEFQKIIELYTNLKNQGSVLFSLINHENTNVLSSDLQSLLNKIDKLTLGNFANKIKKLHAIFCEDNTFEQTTFTKMANIAAEYGHIIGFLKKLPKDNVYKSYLERELIIAVQRIPRYQLLIEELFKSTEDQFLNEKHYLKEIIVVIKKMASSVNDVRRFNEILKRNVVRYSQLVNNSQIVITETEKALIEQVMGVIQKQRDFTLGFHTIKSIKNFESYLQSLKKKAFILPSLRLHAIYKSLARLNQCSLDKLSQLVSQVDIIFGKNIRGLMIMSIAQELNFLGLTLPFNVDIQAICSFLDTIHTERAEEPISSKKLLEIAFNKNSAFDENSPVFKACSRDAQIDLNDHTLFLLNAIRVAEYGIYRLIDEKTESDLLDRLRELAIIAINLFLNQQQTIEQKTQTLHLAIFKLKDKNHEKFPWLFSVLNELVAKPNLFAFELPKNIPKGLVLFNLNKQEQENLFHQLCIRSVYSFIYEYIKTRTTSVDAIKPVATVKQRYIDKLCSYFHCLYTMSLDERYKEIADLTPHYNQSIAGLLKFALVTSDLLFSSRRQDIREGSLAKALDLIEECIEKMDSRSEQNLQSVAVFRP